MGTEIPDPMVTAEAIVFAAVKEELDLRVAHAYREAAAHFAHLIVAARRLIADSKDDLPAVTAVLSVRLADVYTKEQLALLAAYALVRG